MAFHDQLTGLYNRHYVIDKLNELVELSHRYRKGFSLMMLDLDHFKRVNDKHGHLAGDRTLVAVAQCITHTIRATDFAGRYGGEEFIVVCPSTQARDCHELAERIRLAVANIADATLDWPGPQTVSAGVCEIPHRSDKQDVMSLIRQADLALYQAKASGRNQVVVYCGETTRQRA